MIISASRRTDIPAFHAEWFMTCLRANTCEVPNPVNPKQISVVSLAPADVDCVVFWTRNPAPLLPHLDELDDAGYRYLFLYTLLDYPSLLDPGMPPLAERVDTFLQLADRIGAERVAWRYDPIVLSNITPPAFHVDACGRLAEALDGATTRCITSFLDSYARLKPRLEALRVNGCQIRDRTHDDTTLLLPQLAATATAHGMTLQTCAEQDATALGAPPGKCIDDAWLNTTFGLHVPQRKDPGQRTACRCIASRDIGRYDTCPAGCAYCYASGRGS